MKLSTKRDDLRLTLRIDPLRFVVSYGRGQSRELRLIGRDAQSLGSLLFLLGVREMERREAPARPPRVFAASRGKSGAGAGEGRGWISYHAGTYSDS